MALSPTNHRGPSRVMRSLMILSNGMSPASTVSMHRLLFASKLLINGGEQHVTILSEVVSIQFEHHEISK